MLDNQRAQNGLVTLRVLVCLLLITHGVARMWLVIVDDFGDYLVGLGVPFGSAIAWAVTVFEIVGGGVLATGRAVRPLASLFVAELVLGVIMVHASEGWFVVGAGRNGMEYSVLLIAVFAVVAYVGGNSDPTETTTQ